MQMRRERKIQVLQVPNSPYTKEMPILRGYGT